MAIAAKPSLKDSGDRPDAKKSADAKKPVITFLATPMPWPLTQQYVLQVTNSVASGGASQDGMSILLFTCSQCCWSHPR